jgi:hypothetical protein
MAGSMKAETPIFCLLCGYGSDSYVPWREFLEDAVAGTNALLCHIALYTETSFKRHL